MGEHAKYSASGAERWLNCPGSIALSEKAPPQKDSPYAEEGTKAHLALEDVLKFSTPREVAEGEDIFWSSDDYTDEMKELAIKAAEWIWGQAGDDKILSETKVDSSPFLSVPDQFGTLDAAIVRLFGRLTVIDYKYGAGVMVDPAGQDGKGNSQLVYYALALAHKYNFNFADVELVVIQPRAYTESGETIRTHVMSIEELEAWAPGFQIGVFLTQASKPVLSTGKWCRWCPAAVICPKLKEESLAKAQISFSSMMELETVPEPKLIQIPHLGNILNACDRLEDWISKVRDHAFHVLKKGEAVDGYKLVAKRGVRKWKDIEIAEQIALGFLNAKGLYKEVEFLSPAQLEKTYKDTEGLSDFINDQTTSVSSGVTLVPASDKRPAVLPAEKVFDVEFDTVDVLPPIFTKSIAKKRKSR